MFALIFRSRFLVYIPAGNSLKYFFPIIFLICFFRRIPCIYIAVGGWLGKFLETRAVHQFLLRNIKSIYLQSEELTLSLAQSFGFTNVFTLHNFRIHNFVPVKKHQDTEFKVVFMARINRMRGVESIFKLAEKIASSNLPRPVVIDLYGPVDESYKSDFFESLSRYDCVAYNGILLPDSIYYTLGQYDLMILPTRYFTEGFPGSILDAYISGIPVVVSEWRY